MNIARGQAGTGRSNTLRNSPTWPIAHGGPFRSMKSSLNATVQTPPERMKVKLPNLLPDLQHRILRYLLEAEDKASLKACILTCRRWLQVCGPSVFGTVCFRSHEDVDGLLSSLDSTGNRFCPIGRYANNLLLDMSHAEEPWDHLVWGKLAQKLPCISSLSFYNSARTMSLPAHPLMSSLSTSLYAWNFPALRKLRIDNYEFSSFKDLLRLIRNLSALAHLECNNIQWRRSAGLSHCTGTHSKLECVRMNSCTATWPMLFAWMTSTSLRVQFAPHLPQRFPGLCSNDVIILSEICRASRCLSAGNAEFRCHAVQETGECALRSLPSTLLCTDSQFHPGISEFINKSQPMMQIHITENPNSHAADDHQLAGIVRKIVFVDKTLSDLRAAYHWPTLHEILVEFRYLKSITLDLTDDSGHEWHEV